MKQLTTQLPSTYKLQWLHYVFMSCATLISIHCIIIVMFTRTLACISYSLGTSREKPSWPTGGLFLRSTRRVCTATAEYHPTPCRTTSGERSVSFDCKIKNNTVYISFDPSYGGTAIETTVKSGRHRRHDALRRAARSDCA